MFDLDGPALDRATALHTLARADERRVVDFVAAGDSPYLLMEFMVLLAEHFEASAAEFKQLVGADSARFAQLPGSGHLLWHDDTTDQLDHVALSGNAIDPDRLPFIAVNLLTHENRVPVFDDKRTAQVMAGAGCKYACAFCHDSADHFLYGVPKILQRSARNVIHETGSADGTG